MVFKEESGGWAAVPHMWGKKMNKKFGVVEEAPDWWSKALATWTDNHRGALGRPSRSPRGTARAMRTHTQETLQSASEAGKRFYSRKRHERSQGPGQSLNSMTMTRSTIVMSALTSSAVSGRL